MGYKGYKSQPILGHQTPECLGVLPQQKPVYDEKSQFGIWPCALLLEEEIKNQTKDNPAKDWDNQTFGFYTLKMRNNKQAKLWETSFVLSLPQLTKVIVLPFCSLSVNSLGTLHTLQREPPNESQTFYTLVHHASADRTKWATERVVTYACVWGTVMTNWL